MGSGGNVRSIVVLDVPDGESYTSDVAWCLVACVFLSLALRYLGT